MSFPYIPLNVIYFVLKGGARCGDSSEGDTEETGSMTSSHLSEPDSIIEEGISDLYALVFEMARAPRHLFSS